MSKGKSTESFVKNALAYFLQRHSAEASISALDEIIVSYMVGILEEIAAASSSEDVFDVDQFTEMMEPYLPGFSNIDSCEVSEWMLDLAGRLGDVQIDKEVSEHTVEKDDQQASVTQMSEVKKCTKSHPGQKVKKSRQSKSRSSSGSEQSIEQSDVREAERNLGIRNEEHVQMLLEMFPSACSLEVAHCLCLAEGDVDEAAQLVLMRQEAQQCLAESVPKKTHKPSKKKTGLAVLDEKHMKDTIVAKYSYVDMDDDKRDHKPLMPKTEPKKMVRYLDGRVVSTRGERFTELKRDDGDAMKKTYVNLKPAKQYRFH